MRPIARRPIARLVPLALALLLVAIAPILADSPTAAPGPAASPPRPQGITALLVDFQRTANREIGRHLAAIRDGRGAGPLLLGLALAFAYGAVHAAGPGHGKLVVVGYFLSREARIARGLLVGAQIAVLHVLSAVIVVSFADLLLRRTFGGAPAEIPAVRIASYGLILGIGSWMLVRGVRKLVLARACHGHEHGPGCACESRPGAGEGGLLALAVGLVPCTGSLLILLFALANDKLVTGLLLVAAIAAGMAVSMGALGLASVAARRVVLERLALGRPASLLSVGLELLGAGLVSAVGGILLVGSL